MRAALPIAIALALATAGCTTVTPQERRSANEDLCRGYGFKRGTDAFAECLQRIDLERAADRRAWRYANGPYLRGSFPTRW